MTPKRAAPNKKTPLNNFMVEAARFHKDLEQNFGEVVPGRGRNK
jgi:hypothetical protein